MITQSLDFSPLITKGGSEMLNNYMTPLEDIDYHLAQLGAYFAVKIRNNENAETEIELYCALNRIRDYFRSIKGLLEEKQD